MRCCMIRAIERNLRRRSTPLSCVPARSRGLSCLKALKQGAQLKYTLHPAHRFSCQKESLLDSRRCLCQHTASARNHNKLSAASLSTALLPGLALPLSERPVAAEVSKQDLFVWHAKAEVQAKAVGTAFEEADGGPSAEDLLIELNWLLDDAVAAQSSVGESWQPCSWRQLQYAQQTSPQAFLPPSKRDAKVALRLGLHALTDLWNQRTQQRVPLQYLNNCCHWRDLVLAVGPGVLIPRPETELLIDFAQQTLSLLRQAVQKNFTLGLGPWLDLGTGSGAVALGLASILPTPAQVYAVDKSTEALAWAKLNVDRLKFADTVQLEQGEWYSPVMQLTGKFAGIVSNPPYIPHSQMEHLQKEVGQCEPWLALDGGLGLGLDSLTPICMGAADMLQSGGLLALETTGGKQARHVASTLECTRDFQDIEVIADLAGQRRFVRAFRKAT